MYLRILLYTLVVITPVLAKLWLNPGAPLGPVFEIGKGLALTAFTILCLQFVLAARFKWIERPFGLDRLLLFHKAMAICAALMLLMHPLFLAAAGPGASLLFSAKVAWYIWAARIALLLVLLQTVVSLFRKAITLEFERWRRLHNVLAMAILIIIFLHSWNAGSDLDVPFLQGMWLLLLAAALSAYAYHRGIRRRLLRKNGYRVQEVRQEAHNVWTLKMEPPQGKARFDYLPGQFHLLTLYRGRGLPAEEHPFTISSSPTQTEFISATIKESGDFTATIGETKAGDSVAVHGPFGRFSYLLHPKQTELVFIAGGIGITPLMSMLRHMRDTQANKNVLLLYANKTEEDIVFRDELAEIERGERPKLLVIHILSRDQDWHGESGHVDREKIERLCGPDLAAKDFYVCGPPRMMAVVIRELKALGQPGARRHFEHFAL